MTFRRWRLLAVFVALLVVLPACGGGEGNDAGGDIPATVTTSQPGTEEDGGTGITVTAGDLYLKPAEVTAPAGKITVTYVNMGQLQHTLLVDGKAGLDLEVSGKGDADKGTIALQPGTYTLYCDVAGHRAAGMEAKLIVQ